MMPEKTVWMSLPGNKSSIAPVIFLVNNTAQMVNAVRYGTGLEGGPFHDGDYVTFTVTGFRSGNATGSASINLADYETYRDSVVTLWSPLDVSGLSDVDELSFSITSSRDDIPRYVCLDDMLFKFDISF